MFLHFYVDQDLNGKVCLTTDGVGGEEFERKNKELKIGYSFEPIELDCGILANQVKEIISTPEGEAAFLSILDQGIRGLLQGEQIDSFISLDQFKGMLQRMGHDLNVSTP